MRINPLLLALIICCACNKQATPLDTALVQYRLPDATEDSYAETSDASWDVAGGKAYFNARTVSFERICLSVGNLSDTGNYTLRTTQELSWSLSDRYLPQTVNGRLHISRISPQSCAGEFAVTLRDSLNSAPLRMISGRFSIFHYQ